MHVTFINLFKSQQKLSEKWVFFIIFMFPIAGPVIREWNSLFYLFISLTALYFFFTKKNCKPLHKEEKIYLSAITLFFVIYLTSVIYNGYSWGKIQTEGLGTEINYLLFFSVYLLVREYGFPKKTLFAGILLSIPVIFLFSLYEYINIPSNARTVLIGAYSQLFLGPITAFALLMSYYAYKTWFIEKKYYWLIIPYVSMGLFVIMMTKARSSYLIIFVGAITLLFLTSINIKKKIISISLVILIAILSYQIDIVKQRVNSAITNTNNYFDKNMAESSAGLRIEVWRSSQYVFKEHPLIGIGNGNYPNFIQKYIDKGLVNPAISIMGHAHNIFIEALITKGAIGLLLLIIIFYYPFYIAWENRKKHYNNFQEISIFTVSLTLMSLTESMLINKNNGVSYLLMFSAILFASMIREIKSNKNIH